MNVFRRNLIVSLTALIGLSFSTYVVAKITCEPTFPCFQCQTNGNAYNQVWTWTVAYGGGTVTPNGNTAHFRCPNPSGGYSWLDVAYVELEGMPATTERKVINCRPDI